MLHVRCVAAVYKLGIEVVAADNLAAHGRVSEAGYIGDEMFDAICQSLA